MLISTAQPKRIWLWDVRTCQQIREVKLKLKPNQLLFTLAVSSDGKTVASAEKDGVIRLWNAATGDPLRVLQGAEKEIHFLSFSPDNQTLVSTAEKVLQLWNVTSGKRLHRLEHPQDVLTVAFTPDGKTLATAGSDGRSSRGPEGNPSAVRLWDVATGKLLHTLEGHQQVINSLSF